MFNIGGGTDGEVDGIAVQTDGKIVIGGDFTMVNGTSRDHIARLNADGTVDPSLNTFLGAGGEFIGSIVVQPNGKIIIAGTFANVNGVVPQ